MSILLLSYPEDPHVDAVKKSLSSKGGQFVEFCFLQYPMESSLGVELQENHFRTILKINHSTFDTREFSSIWYRRPLDFKTASNLAPDMKTYIQNEARAFWSNINCLFPNALLVSDPIKIGLADNKLFQLQTAVQVGFDIPHTCMGNDPELAKEVMESYEEVLTKPVFVAGFHKKLNFFGKFRKALWNFIHRKELHLLYHTNFSYTEIVTMYSKKLDTTAPDWTNFVSYIPNCPITLQKYIPKKLELRITVVGRKVFACAIHSQEISGQGKVDWRPEVDLMHHEAYQLPPDIEAKCLLLLQKLGLQFGCIDMILTPDNQYIFLEINPNGQWAWIQEKTGLMISDAIADLLMRKEGTAL